MDQVIIRVPATTANLGPGFDTLGCALALYNRITFRKTAHGLTITGGDEAYRNKNNLAYRAYQAVVSRAKQTLPDVAIAIEAAIPIGRGLGSSAAMIIAGAMGANALLNEPFSDDELLAIALTLEPHPDNLTPCLYGGLTAALLSADQVCHVRYAIAPTIKLCVLIPDYQTNTAQARQALPDLITRADCVYELSHLALLLKALETGDQDLIGTALNDRIHQPYRQALIPDYPFLKQQAMDHGAYAFFISGSGPTCIALYDNEDFIRNMNKGLDNLSNKWQVLKVGIDHQGARKVICDGETLFDR